MFWSRAPCSPVHLFFFFFSFAASCTSMFIQLHFFTRQRGESLKERKKKKRCLQTLFQSHDGISRGGTTETELYRPPTCFMFLMFVRQQGYTNSSLSTNQVCSYFCVSVCHFTQGVKVCAVGTPGTVCSSGDDGAEAHVLLIIVDHLIKDEI